MARLAEYDEKREMSGTVTCLSLGEVPEGPRPKPIPRSRLRRLNSPNPQS